MGLMSWLSSPHRSAARKQIQQGLQVMKSQGLFDDDPTKGAQAVEAFSASQFSKAVTDNMNATMLAVSWLVVFVRASHAPRDYLLPFANVGLGLLRMVTASNSRLSSWEEGIVQRAFLEFQEFIDASSINLNLNTQQPLCVIVPIDGPNSMFCIMAERNYLDTRYGVGGWQLVSQASIEEDGRLYDKLTIALMQGKETVVWFDLTESRKKWTTEGNLQALQGFQQMASETIGKHKLDAAKQVITECLNSLKYQEVHRELTSYLPIEETVARLNDHAVKEKLNAEELALLLVDAGMADHSAATASAAGMFSTTFHTALGEGSKDMAQSLAAAGLARHDRLLTEVFKRAAEKGTLLVPQYGSAGTAMKNALGTLIEPSISPEKKSNAETPRDRDRAMTELINKMKS